MKILLHRLKYFRKNGLKFPTKLNRGPNKGDIEWGWLVHSRAIQILHNPRYAGAFCYGRMKSKKLPDGTVRYKISPQDQWNVLLKDFHDGYISWEEYEANQKQLRQNAQAYGVDKKNGPPREGPALLQGLVICGVCGRKMTTGYHKIKATRIPYYRCQRLGIENGEPICQSIHGGVVDEAIGKLLIESVSPLVLEVALKVQDELTSRFEETDRLRKQQVERAGYEAGLARRRYMQVDPENRLVASSLEAEWNKKIRELKDVQEEYERLHKKDSKIFSTEERENILTLATDFPRLWNDENTSYIEKKRMVRLLIEDVTLQKDKERKISMDVRFKGGAHRSLDLVSPPRVFEVHKNSKEIISQIDRLLDYYTDAEIADILNKEGKKSETGLTFRALIIATIRRRSGLKSRYERLREKKLLTINEIAGKLKISKKTVREWAKIGMIKIYRYNDKNSCLYELDVENLIAKLKKEQRGRRTENFISQVYDRISEVQYEV